MQTHKINRCVGSDAKKLCGRREHYVFNLFATVLATFVFFDAFRNQSINLKAAYNLRRAQP
jgi:hypothetical protein